MKQFTLNTGRPVPAIGFGTWKLSEAQAVEAVCRALEVGYRVIDTAAVYGNEHAVGEAIRRSGVPRAELFVTTKLWNDCQGYDRTLKAFEESRRKLGLDYIDLYLIHWPATPERHDSWRAFEQLLADGKLRAAGVSNFTVEHLQELAQHSQLTPAVNQIEFHPFIYQQQRGIQDYCADRGILIEAYSPLSRLSGSVPPELRQIAEQTGKTPQQVVLRWCVQQGTLPLPRSANPDHIEANFDIFDFELDKDAMTALNSLSDGYRVTWDPSGMG